jgi:hypothetical protein
VRKKERGKDDNKKDESDDALAKRWECPDCGFIVMPGYCGHRCMFRSEMYTPKPGVE